MTENIPQLGAAADPQRIRTWGWLHVQSVPFLILTALSVLVVLSCRVFPSQDGPLHLYYADVTRDLLFHTGHYQSAFVIKHYLAPYSFDTYLLVFLDFIFDPLLSEKILVCVYLIGFGYGFRYLVKSIAPANDIVPLLSFLFVFNHSLCMGFYNFCLGMAMSLWVAGFWVRHSGGLKWNKSLVFAALMILVTLTHAVALALCLLFLGLHTAVAMGMRFRNIGGRPVRRIKQTLALQGRMILHTAAAASALFWVLRFGSSDTDARVTAGSVAERVHEFLLMWSVAPVRDRAYRWSLLAVVAAAAAAAFFRPWRKRWALSSTGATSVPLMGAACLCLSLVLPTRLGGGTSVGGRFALVGILFVIAAVAVGTPLPVRMARLVAAATFATSLALFAYLFQVNQRALAGIRPFLDAPVLPAGLRAAWVMGDLPELAELTCAPRFWAGAHYARRSKAVLVNYGWLDLLYLNLAPRKPGACGYLNCDKMRSCLLDFSASPQRPDLDLIISGSADASALGGAYGLRRLPFSTVSAGFWAKPGTVTPELRLSIPTDLNRPSERLGRPNTPQ
jgi:hypothetical protein